jgi:hypothetical protein
MAEDTTGWSEKGNKRPKGSDGDATGSTTPSRPSKRQASDRPVTDGESSVVRTPASSDGARKVAKAAATAGQRDVSFASRMGFPALIALICILGIGLVVYARSTREALATPVQNLDHWHAVYGVYNCNLPGEGEAKYLPPFLSTQDDTGIHSHGDGIMHVHPFFELSSGDNAQTRHFFSEMNVEVSPERITVQNQYDPFVDLVAGEECADGSGTAEIKILHWDFDFEALSENRPDPEVFETDLGLIKFDHDREVYIIAYVGEDTAIEDIPIPPMDRFNTLNNVSSAIEYDPSGALNAIDTGIDLDGDDADAGDDAEASE